MLFWIEAALQWPEFIALRQDVLNLYGMERKETSASLRIPAPGSALGSLSRPDLSSVRLLDVYLISVIGALRHRFRVQKSGLTAAALS